MKESQSATGNWKKVWDYKVLCQRRTLPKREGCAVFRRMVQMEEVATKKG